MELSFHQLSWNETSFPAKFRLWRRSSRHEGRKIRSGDPVQKASGCIALASTCYSVKCTAFAHLKNIFSGKIAGGTFVVRLVAWVFTWGPLAMWCHFHDLRLARTTLDIRGNLVSADECDICQSIFASHRDWERAAACITAGLSKDPKPHTKGLLRASLAKIHAQKGNWSEASVQIDQAVDAALKAEDYDQAQAARIYRKCADAADQIHRCGPFSGEELRRIARLLADRVGAKDQLLKSQA
jgi:hypothetical protein